jgi:hypothetical protein
MDALICEVTGQQDYFTMVQVSGKRLFGQWGIARRLRENCHPG